MKGENKPLSNSIYFIKNNENMKFKDFETQFGGFLTFSELICRLMMSLDGKKRLSNCERDESLTSGNLPTGFKRLLVWPEETDSEKSLKTPRLMKRKVRSYLLPQICRR